MNSTHVGSVSAAQFRASSNAAVGTADATVATLLPGQALLIQNLDDAALYVKLGAACTTSSFNFILKACTVANDGVSEPFLIENWVGIVSVAAATGTARYIATVLS